MSKLALGISHQQDGTTIVAMTPQGDDKWLVVSNSFHPEGDSSLLIDIPDVPQWRRVQDSLPDVGQWCLVMVDRDEGDYWYRLNKPRFEVFAAQLYDIDSEGYGYWRRWRMPDGGPMGEINHVAWWMPYPQPFTE